MRTIEQVTPTSIELQSWSKLREQYPNEWMCLIDVEIAGDGSIRAARVLAHDSSAHQMLKQITAPPPGTIVVHTWGRPLTTPRMEMTDEIREIIRARG